MSDKPLFILKLGGSVITEKDENLTMKEDEIERLTTEIAEAKNEGDFNLVLVNGAGSFGHYPVMEYDLYGPDGVKEMNEERIFGVTKVHKHVEDLNRKIWDELEKHHIPAMPVHPSSCVVQEDSKLVKFEIEPIKLMLENNIIILSYGDMAPDRTKSSTIISGDIILTHLGEELDADKLLVGSDIDGVFTGDPNEDSDAYLISLINGSNLTEVIDAAGKSRKIDATGGMGGKLRSILDMKKKIRSLIFNAKTEGLTKRVLLGEEIGTVIDFIEVGE